MFVESAPEVNGFDHEADDRRLKRQLALLNEERDIRNE
jgi:hypothetical protein